MINRNAYLNQLKVNKDKKVIKVITGVRRCGKSTLFSLFIAYLKEIGVENASIISINLEDLQYEHLLNYRTLYDFINSNLSKNKTYVFIDEIQNCKDFEKAADSLFIKENIDLYITGSNAYMLSGELATLLSGRYIQIEMLPFSFSEYCESVQKNNLSLRSKFADYLEFGSFPYLAEPDQNKDFTRPYLEGIYNTILIKDVVKREGITDISVLEMIIKVLASSIGSPISSNKIANTLKSSGRKISVNTVDRYIRALTDSYIFYKVGRYDGKGRMHLKTLGKYYIVDTGIRRMLSSGAAEDLGHLIENIVYFELLRRDYKVYTGKVSKKEVDFVATSADEVLYCQVSASVLDEKTLQRELEPLKLIQDHHRKILLTLDEIGAERNFAGIKQLNLIEWLLQR